MRFQGWIVAQKAAKGVTQLGFVVDLIGDQGDADHRLGEVDRLECHWSIDRAKGVTRVGGFQTNHGNNDSGSGDFQLFALVTHHAVHTTNAFLTTIGGVQYRVAGVEFARIHAHINEVASWLGNRFEGQTGKMIFWIRATQDFFLFLATWNHAFNWRTVAWSRQQVDDMVEQLLHAVEVLAGTAHHWGEQAAQGAFTQGGLQEFFGNGLFIENQFSDLVVRKRCHFQKFSAALLGFGAVAFWDFYQRKVDVALIFRVAQNKFHANQIDNAFEIGVGANWNGANGGFSQKLFLHLADATVEIRTCAVEFVDVGDAGNFVLVGLKPHGFRLDFHTTNGAEHTHCTVKNAQGSLHFSGEVHVTGGIDNVDLIDAPVHRNGGRVNRDTLGAFQWIEVGCGIAGVHVTHFVLGTTEVKNTLGCGRLAGIDVRDDADVAYIAEGVDGHDRYRCRKTGLSG